MTAFKRYCNPGEKLFPICWADSWGTTPEIITEVLNKHPAGAEESFEQQFQRFLRVFNDLKSRGLQLQSGNCRYCNE